MYPAASCQAAQLAPRHHRAHKSLSRYAYSIPLGSTACKLAAPASLGGANISRCTASAALAAAAAVPQHSRPCTAPVPPANAGTSGPSGKLAVLQAAHGVGGTPTGSSASSALQAAAGLTPMSAGALAGLGEPVAQPGSPVTADAPLAAKAPHGFGTGAPLSAAAPLVAKLPRGWAPGRLFSAAAGRAGPSSGRLARAAGASPRPPAGGASSSRRERCSWKAGVTQLPLLLCAPAQLNVPSRAPHLHSARLD